MVRPRATVRVEWAYGWDSSSASEELSARLAASGVELIFHQNSLTGSGYKGEYGLYSMAWDEDRKRFAPKDYVAAPVWNWGVFYEKLLSEILGSGSRISNRWWGMDSGAVDLRYSKRHVPLETHRLVSLLKRLINDASFNPFDGPLVDNQGLERIKQGERPSLRSLMAMDYFVDGISSDLVDAKAGLPNIGPMQEAFEPG
jgi:basic membrane protein A